MTGFNHDTKAERDREEMEGQPREVWYQRATAAAGVIRALYGAAKHGLIDSTTFLAKYEPLRNVLALDEVDESMRWNGPTATQTQRLPCAAWESLGGDDWQLRAGMFLASANDETGWWVVLLSLDVGKFGQPLPGHVFGSVVGTNPVNVIMESGASGGRLAAEDAIDKHSRAPLAVLARR